MQPNVLVASKQSGFKTVADLVAAAKAKPGTLTFASAGVGSSSHMAGEKLRLAAKIDVRHVPFRDKGLTEVMAGRIDYYFIPLAAAASALGSGKLTVLAVSSPSASPLLPDVPSIVEAGYPTAEFNFWVGLSAPAKTPRAIVDKLHDATEKALHDPAIMRETGEARRRARADERRCSSASSSKTTSPRPCNSPRTPISSRWIENVIRSRRSGGAIAIYRFNSAIRLDVSQRLPPIVCTCE